MSEDANNTTPQRKRGRPAKKKPESSQKTIGVQDPQNTVTEKPTPGNEENRMSTRKRELLTNNN